MAFVYGNIIKPNDIFKVSQFNVLCNTIESKISTPDIIRALNKIFTPITPENDCIEQLSIANQCDIYDNIMISHMQITDNILMLNNEILNIEQFINIKVGQKITSTELIIIDSSIEFNWGIIENG